VAKTHVYKHCGVVCNDVTLMPVFREVGAATYTVSRKKRPKCFCSISYKTSDFSEIS